MIELLHGLHVHVDMRSPFTRGRVFGSCVYIYMGVRFPSGWVNGLCVDVCTVHACMGVSFMRGWDTVYACMGVRFTRGWTIRFGNDFLVHEGDNCNYISMAIGLKFIKNSVNMHT